MSWLSLLWVAGVAVSLLQMAAAYLALWRVRGRAKPLDDRGMARTLAGDLGIAHTVPVLDAGPGRMPMAFGVFRPAILMPAEASAWSEERLRVVLLHELAHVQRGDGASHLLARLALALHWWNPLAWTAWRECVKERERAADDLVLASGARASDYAGHLLEVARSMQPAPATVAAAVAMARRSDLEGRLLAILDTRRRSAGFRSSAAAVAAFLAIVIVAPFAAMRAQEARPAVPPDVAATFRAATAQKSPDLLDQAASAYSRELNYDTAQILLENALAIREQKSGQNSPEYAEGLVNLGDLASKARRRNEAISYYARAAALGAWPETVPALMYLGVNAYGQKEDAAAQGFFERILAIQPSGARAGQALAWMASIQQRKGDLAQAEGLFQRALAATDGSSESAATTMELYSLFLQAVDRAPEADTWKQRAQAMRRTLYEIRPATIERAAQATPMRVGPGMEAPKLLYKQEPEYTEEARAAKYQGTTILKVEVGIDGLAHNIQVSRGIGLGLDEMAIDAVTRWKFKPASKDGQVVPVLATIEVNFRLM